MEGDDLCTRLGVRRTGRPPGPAPYGRHVRTLEQSEFYVADVPAILVGDPTVALYVAAILARRLDAANRWLVGVKRQLQTGEPPSVIGKAVDPTKIRWELPENFDEEEARSLLLTPYRALASNESTTLS